VLPLLPGNKIAAIKVYRQKAGASLAEAKEAVEAIARKHGIAFGPVPLWNRLSALVLLGLGLVLVASAHRLDLSPVVSAPVVLLLGSVPAAADAWRFRGTRRGRWAAFWAGLFLFFTVGIPLLELLAQPGPALGWLYERTGAKPGRDDVAFLQAILVASVLALLAWLAWLLRKLRAGQRATRAGEGAHQGHGATQR
jgi:hypothetical protein